MPPAGEREPRHIVRIVVTWLVLSAIATPVVFFVLGPHLPPGGMTDSADGQRWDNTVLATFATPVILAIWVYFAYALRFFRQRGPEIVDGPPIKGHAGFQIGWIAVTASIVLFMFGFGTYELIVPMGAGAGEGPNPIWKPAANVKPLVVQVIGQQWRWTYRYPGYKGVETARLVLPVDTQIQFNVTSLDVIHSFWAYQLGVKADANPMVNNVAYTKTFHTGKITVRCDELCGLWHGAMYNYGAVVTQSQFQSWMQGELAKHAKDLPLLPPYSTTYLPQAGGGYYDPGSDPFPVLPVPKETVHPSASPEPPAPSPSAPSHTPAAGTNPSPSPTP